MERVESLGCDPNLFEFRNLCHSCASEELVRQYGLRGEMLLAGIPWGIHDDWLHFGDQAPYWWARFGNPDDEKSKRVFDLPRLKLAWDSGVTPAQILGWQPYVSDPLAWVNQMTDWARWDVNDPSELVDRVGRSLYDDPLDIEYPPPLELKHELGLSLEEVARWWRNGFEYDGEGPYELIKVFLRHGVGAETAGPFVRCINELLRDGWSDLSADALDDLLTALTSHSVSLGVAEMTAWCVVLFGLFGGDCDLMKSAMGACIARETYLSLEGVIDSRSDSPDSID